MYPSAVTHATVGHVPRGTSHCAGDDQQPSPFRRTLDGGTPSCSRWNKKDLPSGRDAALGRHWDRQHRPRCYTSAGLDVAIAAGFGVPRGTSFTATVDPALQRRVTHSGYSRSAPSPRGNLPTVPRGTPILTGDGSRWSERETTDSADPVEVLGNWTEKGGVYGPRPRSASRCRRKVDVGSHLHLSRLCCRQTSMPTSGTRSDAERASCRRGLRRRQNAAQPSGIRADTATSCRASTSAPSWARHPRWCGPRESPVRSCGTFGAPSAPARSPL